MSFGDRPKIDPASVIWHIRSTVDTGKTLCGRSYGRTYCERPETPATCKKCIRLDAE